MRKLAIFLGLAAVCAAFGRFLLAPLFLSEPAGGATAFLFAAAAGLLTIAIAAAVGK